MKKIIIYGISQPRYNMRMWLENFLDDNYEIIGYSDGLLIDRVGMRDFLHGKPFFRPEDICKQQADFILMNAITEPTYKSIRRNLTALGVSPEKIIRPTMYLDINSGAIPIDLVGEIKKQYNNEKGLIFGLSYSLVGIMEKDLDVPFYDCSWACEDLYYNFHIYDHMQKHRIFTNIHTALWVFPYYYFDYDLTMSSNMMSIFPYWRLNDWHHCPSEHVENFKMFSKKVTDFFRMPKYLIDSPLVYGGTDGTGLFDPIWFENHEDTVLENERIFIEFFNKLTKKGVNVILVIPPLYLNGLNTASKVAVQLKKEKFYRILQKLEGEAGKIPIFDYTDRFAEKRENFWDLTHLNYAGAAEFTNILNAEIINGLPQ